MEPEQHKREFWKFALGFVAIIFGVLVLLVIWKSYQLEQGRKKGDQLAIALEEGKKRDYEIAMADTYGGKTPQETLSLYITAVEKGDYELASKYFIQDNQEGELKKLKQLNKENDFNTFFSLLKKSESWRSSLEDNTYTLHSRTDSGPDI